MRSKSNFDFQPRDISNMPSREINRSQIQKIKNIYHIQNNHSANFKPVLPTRNKQMVSKTTKVSPVPSLNLLKVIDRNRLEGTK